MSGLSHVVLCLFLLSLSPDISNIS